MRRHQAVWSHWIQGRRTIVWEDCCPFPQLLEPMNQVSSSETESEGKLNWGYSHAGLACRRSLPNRVNVTNPHPQHLGVSMTSRTPVANHDAWVWGQSSNHNVYFRQNLGNRRGVEEKRVHRVRS